jgi:CBS domain-containing protein
MSLKARDVMRTDVVTVKPETPVWELEEILLRERIQGAPVVEDGALLGIVSRSDVFRQLHLEQSRAEAESSFYLEPFDVEKRTEEDDKRVSEAVATRLRNLRVREVMIRETIIVSPDAPLSEVASQMLERRIHRVLVGEGGGFEGLVSSLDLIRLFAQKRVTAT